MNKLNNCIFTCVFLFAILQISGAKENSYYENINLFTDRQIYISGESIWFRAICSDHEGLSDSILSKIIYLELYDQRLNSVARGKYRLNEGSATGRLEIPSDISSGNYFIRAYTQFLRNYPPFLYCSDMITIVNPKISPPDNENMLSDEIDIVTESGTLISGVSNKLAVRLTPALNKKIADLIIVDRSGLEVARVIPWSNGLALFEFVPDSGNAYSLKLLHHNGIENNRSLPAVSGTGMIMRSDFSDKMLIIKLIQGNPPKIQDTFILELRSPALEIVFRDEIKRGKSSQIPVSELGHGMNFLLLRNELNEIVNIQPVFYNKNIPCDIGITIKQPFYKQREIVDLDYNLPPGLTRQGIYVSVTLKGTTIDKQYHVPYYVTYNPALFRNYFFNAGVITGSLGKQLEALAIFYSKELKKEDFEPIVMQWLPEIRDAGISGLVTEKNTRQPLKDIMVYASVTGGANQVHIYKTDADGKFYFSMNHLSGMHNVYVSPRPVEGIQMEMDINSDFSNAYSQSARMIPVDLDSTDKTLLDWLYKNDQLNTAFPRYSEASIDDTLYYPIPATYPEFSIKLDDYIEMPVMTEVFSELVPFTTVRKKGDRFFLNVYNEKTMDIYTDPLVLLDGIPVFDLKQLMEVSPELVERIEVVNRKAFLGNHTLDGIVSVNTSTSNFAGISFPESSSFIEFQSITTGSYPEFPDHEQSDTNDRNPDFRTLLFWDPSLQANRVRFSASDHCGTYDVIIRSTDGRKPCVGKTTFRIERSK